MVHEPGPSIPSPPLCSFLSFLSPPHHSVTLPLSPLPSHSFPSSINAHLIIPYVLFLPRSLSPLPFLSPLSLPPFSLTCPLIHHHFPFLLMDTSPTQPRTLAPNKPLPPLTPIPDTSEGPVRQLRRCESSWTIREPHHPISLLSLLGNAFMA